MRFASTSRPLILPAAMRTVVEMLAVRAKAAIDASLPKKSRSPTPQSTWVARPGVDPFFAYDANYLIDNKAGIIIDAVGTPANRAVEIAVTQTMVDRVERRFDLRPRRLCGRYGLWRGQAAQMVGGSQHHAARTGVVDKSARPDGTFSRSDFSSSSMRSATPMFAQVARN